MPQGYSPRPLPRLPGDVGPWTRTELQDVAQSLTGIILMLPASAVAAPSTLIHGMIRKAKAPWRPVAGQTTDRWVIYDADVPGWKYID